MLDGKKSIAFNIFYDAIEEVSEKTKEDGLEVWKKALENVTPAVEVRSRRVGGATFQIPQPIREDRKVALGMKWLIGFSRGKRNEKNMSSKLAAEIIAASKEEGASFKKKEDTHRMAEANKAFSHFRF